MGVLRGADLPDRWVVVIDAAGDLSEEPVDGSVVESLIDHLADYSPSVSHRPRRYSTRLSVYATEALDAASGAVDLWREAADEVGLPDWRVVRVEVSRV